MAPDSVSENNRMMIYRRLQARNPMMCTLPNRSKKSTHLPAKTSDVPRCPFGWQFGEFEVQRIGVRYRVVHRCSDRVVRDTHTGRFWRWTTAARIAQGMNLAHRTPVPGDIGRVGWRVREVVSPDQDRLRVALMLGLSDDPTTWPVEILDRLIIGEQMRGNAWLMTQVSRLLRPN